MSGSQASSFIDLKSQYSKASSKQDLQTGEKTRQLKQIAS